MAYHLKSGESVPQGIKRIAAEQLGKAIEHLQSTAGERDEHIHQARKATKRLRALVRLVRRELGEDSYALENQYLRDAGQRLSGLRDATVLIQTLDRLVQYLGKNVPESRFGRVRQWLVRRRAEVYGQPASSEGASREVADDLKVVLGRLESWDLQRPGWGALSPGLERMYARGQSEFEAAYWLPGEEAFHDWRKRVKYLCYQTQILQHIWFPGMKPLTDELDQLGELLGQDHDLAVLRQTVINEFPRAGSTATLRALERRIDAVQSQLQLRARLVATRIYAERPRDFARRLGGYWRAWKADADEDSLRVYGGLGSVAAEQGDKTDTKSVELGAGAATESAPGVELCTPFEVDEGTTGRTGFTVEKMRAALVAAGLDAAVISSLPNFRYTTGIQILSHAALPQRLQMLILPAAGEPVLLACETLEVLQSQAPNWLDDIRTYREFEKGPIDLLAEVLQEKGLNQARLGIERDVLALHFWEQLQQQCPQASFEAIGPLMDKLRAHKEAGEIEALRQAYLRTVAAIRTAFEATRVGDSEAQIAARIRSGLVQRGATQIDFDIVVIGEHSPWAHPPPGQRCLGLGEVLRVDVAATFGLYAADVGRTAVAGRWPPDLRDAFDRLSDIRAQVIPRLEIGLPIGQIYSRIRQCYPRYGLPTPPIHTLLWGHSIGIEVHEPPIISPPEQTPLSPGMVLNIEPDVRPPGLCLTHECAYLVNKSGVELLALPECEAPLVVDPT